MYISLTQFWVLLIIIWPLLSIVIALVVLRVYFVCFPPLEEGEQQFLLLCNGQDRQPCFCYFFLFSLSAHSHRCRRGEFAALARPIRSHLCASAANSAHAYTPRNDVCFSGVRFACVCFDYFCVPFWRPSHRAFDVQYCTHTARSEKGARFLPTISSLLLFNTPLHSVYHLLPHCCSALRRCSVVINQSEQEAAAAMGTITITAKTKA